MALDEMRSRDGDELKMLEDTLGWRIQGVGGKLARCMLRSSLAEQAADLLMMTFTLIDPSDPDKEFAITIETSKFEYAGEPMMSTPNAFADVASTQMLASIVRSSRDGRSTERRPRLFRLYQAR